MKKLIILAALTVRLAAAPEVPPIVKLSQEFSMNAAFFHDQYQIWVEEKNAELRQPGTVSASARRQWDSQVRPSWQAVQQAFKSMDLVVKNE